MISEKQFQLLEIAFDNGGVDTEMASEIYWHRSSISEALNDLEEMNFVKKEKAPPSSRKEQVFFLTEYGKSLVKSQRTDNSDDSE